ncbi:MAG: 1-deoxy-D-xylulose-5-phosphate reductoisomerase, partial [Mycobacterium sp.]|nr:1-deoxy-D-xylulose-5-phosphate reductoisomerase [Mycobacterium sp.]
MSQRPASPRAAGRPASSPAGDSSGAPVARHNEWVSNRRLKTLVLGSTGSIGTQALEVIAANPDRFELVGLAAGGANPELLAQQRAQTGVTNLAVADERAAQAIGDVTHSGPDAVVRLIENTEADVVLNALVGALGLQPTLTALTSGARLALANKESLIAGGPLVLAAAKPG